jgi:hypothetical protein
MREAGLDMPEAQEGRATFRVVRDKPRGAAPSGQFDPN